MIIIKRMITLYSRCNKRVIPDSPYIFCVCYFPSLVGKIPRGNPFHLRKDIIKEAGDPRELIN